MTDLTSDLAPARPLTRTTTRLTDGTNTLTSDTLARRVHRAAKVFTDRGIRPGDRIVVKGDNSADYVIALLALMHLGASLVPVDHRQSAAEGQDATERSQARWLLCESGGVDYLPAHRVLHFPDTADTNAQEPAPRDGAGAVDLSAWFDREDAVVLWSSGTTGRPKGIVKSGRAVLDNTVRTIQAMGYRDDDVLAPLLPFSHQYGLSVILLWWVAGCTLAVTPYQRLDLAAARAARAGATAVDAAPSTYHALLGLLRRRPELRAGLSQVRVWGVGGAPLPQPLAASFLATMKLPLLDGYGLSELGNVALATPDSPRGCGRPLPGIDLRIVGTNGQPLPPGATGEIQVRSPGLMEGYLGADATVLPVERDAWYPTADLGRMDADGTVHVIGRNQAVHRLGFTLYPEGLARKAEGCGQQVEVLAVDDARRGCTLHFVIEDPTGGEPRHWRSLIAPHLAEYEQPNVVHVVQHLPLSANGKVDTGALRRLLDIPAR